MRKSWCICQICTCGRHRCPHKPTVSPTTPLKACLLTEYQQSYKNNEGFHPPHSIKPVEMARPETAPMDLTTTNRVTYKVHNIQPSLKKPQAAFDVPKGSLHLETTYRKVYTSKQVVKEKSYKTRSEYIVPTAKFNASTVNRDSFKPWDVTPRRTAKPDNDKGLTLIVFENDDGKSDKKSTSQVDFQRYSIARPVIVKPATSNHQSGGNFDANTIHRLCYTPKQVQIFRPKASEKYRPNSGEIDCLTTHKQDYIQHRASPVPPCKPSHKSHISDEKSNYTTTNQEAYKVWKVSRPMYMDQMEQYKIPNKSMDFNTVSRSTYVHHPKTEKAAAKKPEGAMIVDSDREPFQDLTTNRSDYQAWESLRPQLNREQRVYIPSQDKFDTQSTHRACFQGQFVPPAASCKPNKAYIKADGDMYLLSSYRDNYKISERPNCPAIALMSNQSNSNPSSFKYSHQGQNGHKFYRMTIENKDAKMTVDVPKGSTNITVSVPT